MTLQLNPDTSDGYQTKTRAELRALVFNGLGFIDPLSGDGRDTLGAIRRSILARLGLAAALLSNNDTFANILTDVYNACGFAAMGTHPPGVDTLLGTYITEAHAGLFARLELDKGGVTPAPFVSGGTSTIDGTLVRMAAIALAKAHYGKPDAGAYAQQAEKYLADLTQRTPPNIVGIVNAAIVQAHATVYRRYELGYTDLTNEFGSLDNPRLNLLQLVYDTAGYNTTRYDDRWTVVDGHPVQLLALANLKKKIGHADADVLREEYERYMAEVAKRQPANAVSVVNGLIQSAQDTLYGEYKAFRMQRWYEWDLAASQRFVGAFDDDNANSLAPTGLTAVSGSSVASHHMTDARYDLQQITLNTGNVLVLGGLGTNSIADLSSAELFNPDTGKYTTTGSMHYARENSRAALLQDGRVLVTGGFNGAALASCEIYDPTTGTFSDAASMSGARYGHTITVLQDGTVLVTGGSNGSPLDSAEVYDPATNSWSAAGNLPSARVHHTATLLANGSVLIAGGSTGVITDTASLYNPTTTQFTATGNMNVARTAHTATLLGNGQVLITGGSGIPSLDSAEVFDPANGIFNSTGSMANGRAGHSAVLLNDGTVLVAGGTTTTASSNPTDTADLYDPSAGTFSAAGTTMAAPATNFGMSSMLDGRVLISGGYSTSAAVLKTAMIYDPDMDAFAATGSLTQGTNYYVVTAVTANGESLPSSEVFVVGVGADTAVNLSWTPYPRQPFVRYFNIYRGKATGEEGFIAQVARTVTTYTDDGTIPAGDAPPTENTTAGPGALDPEGGVTWVGIAQSNNQWRPLIEGIPPTAYHDPSDAIPQFYEIRDAIELWPAPADATWTLKVKGYFLPQQLTSDDDTVTVNWQAVYLRALADAKVFYKQPDAPMWEKRAQAFVGSVIAGKHGTRRYVPGSRRDVNYPPRPVLAE